jgi:hypothetical protein
MATVSNREEIQNVLRYAHDLPSLENKFRGIANTVLDLEIKKKELNVQLLDLRYLINQFQNAIDMKRERLSNMELTMSQPAIRYGKSKSSKSKSNE